MHAPHAREPLRFANVGERARGHWREVWGALGIDVPPGTRHAPCPGCGGRDRFRADDVDGRGTWICSGGGAGVEAGDGFALLRHVTGCTPSEALHRVASVLGIEAGTPLPPAPPRATAAPSGPQDEGLRAHALALWARADRRDVAVAAHGYSRRKGIAWAAGCGVVGDLLLVPIRAHGVGAVVAVQAIDTDGGKRTFGRMTAPDATPGFLVLGNDLPRDATPVVTEGLADAVAVAHRTGGRRFACVAFGLSRLASVARQVGIDYPGRVPLVVRDADEVRRHG